MVIDAQKKDMLLQLEKAYDCGEVEQIIDRYVKLMQDKQIYPGLIAYYLHKLRDSIEELSPADFDIVHWRNIRYAIAKLKRMTGRME